MAASTSTRRANNGSGRRLRLRYDVAERDRRAVASKAMPMILHPRDFLTWLDGSHAEALALVKPYDGPMHNQVATPNSD